MNNLSYLWFSLICILYFSELGRRPGQQPVPELKLIEFKAETYNGLVRLLRPGCRTIILICDIDSKNALVSKFFKIMWPYRRNKTLNFGYLFIEKVCITGVNPQKWNHWDPNHSLNHQEWHNLSLFTNYSLSFRGQNF